MRLNYSSIGYVGAPFAGIPVRNDTTAPDENQSKRNMVIKKQLNYSIVF